MWRESLSVTVGVVRAGSAVGRQSRIAGIPHRRAKLLVLEVGPTYAAKLENLRLRNEAGWLRVLASLVPLNFLLLSTAVPTLQPAFLLLPRDSTFRVNFDRTSIRIPLHACSVGARLNVDITSGHDADGSSLLDRLVPSRFSRSVVERRRKCRRLEIQSSAPPEKCTLPRTPMFPSKFSAPLDCARLMLCEKGDQILEKVHVRPAVVWH